MSQPQYAQPIIPCDCGSPEPYWHGPKGGLRIYCCDDCWKKWLLSELRKYTDGEAHPVEGQP